VAVLGFKGINYDSAGIYHLMDTESTGGMVIARGITSSGTMNPPEEFDSARNYKIIDEESAREMGFCWELLFHGR
jgi:hypothetical protein